MFLDKLTADMPFKVEAIQVDGGSEFMAEFEDACQSRAIKLFVLPPKSPEINGAVERCNGAWRYEFYAVYDLPTRVDQLNPSSTPSSTATTPTDPTAPLAERPPPSTLLPASQETHASHMS